MTSISLVPEAPTELGRASASGDSKVTCPLVARPTKTVDTVETPSLLSLQAVDSVARGFRRHGATASGDGVAPCLSSSGGDDLTYKVVVISGTEMWRRFEEGLC